MKRFVADPRRGAWPSKRLLIVIRSRLIPISIVLAVFGWLGGSAAAQDYPTETGVLTVVGSDHVVPGDDGEIDEGPAQVASGTEIRISGGGFMPGSVVTLTIESEPTVVGTTTADSLGDIDAVVTVPAEIEAGDHTVKATGEAAVGGRLVLELPVEVTATPVERQVGPASRDSENNAAVIVALGLAAALILGGSWFSVRSSRKRAR